MGMVHQFSNRLFTLSGDMPFKMVLTMVHVMKYDYSLKWSNEIVIKL